MANATTIITDLKSVQTTGFSSAAKGRAIAAAGPIQDLDGLTSILLVKAQEMKAILNYMISPNYMIGGGNLGGSGAVVQNGSNGGDGQDTTVEGKLEGILNDLV
jgi:hypothetical protein